MSQLPPPLNLEHLERPGLRERMAILWDAERADLEVRLPRRAWPYGADLLANGWDRYLDLMPLALRNQDMRWLAGQLLSASLWRAWRYQTRKGKPYQVQVNVRDAAVKLAYTEFSIAYVRAVATLALEAGITTCEVYRAAPAALPRWACTCNEGAVVSCTAILEGLRAYFTGTWAEISIPAGPHCHHSIRIRQWLAEAA